MMCASGVLIAIEGVDGAGKNTQVGALRVEVEKLGYAVSNYTFPDYDGSSLGGTLKEMLAGKFGNATQIHPRISAPLFALERSEKCDRIHTDLAAGKVVLCDRYVYSNVAHQACRLPSAERSRFQDWLETVEFGILKLPRPHLTILLDVDPQLAVERRRKRAYESGQTRPLDDYEKDEESIVRARSIYLSLADELKWAVVPTSDAGRVLSREIITGDILRYAKRVLLPNQ